MNRKNRIISLLLTALLLLGSLSVLSVVSVYAAENSSDGGTSGEETTTKVDYTKKVYATPEEKLATMRLAFTKGNFELYVDDYSGEVATVNTVTGEKLFTNPYDVGASTGSESTKQQILSQIVVKYTDNDTERYFYSYEMAALRDQIVVKNIKNGIRVEYTIGREQAKMLLPRLITKERFENVILKSIAENMIGGENAFLYGKFTAYYQELNLDTLTSERAKAELKAAFPITEKFPVYVFDEKASDVNKTTCEDIIKTYCPEYTYEDLEADHAQTEYESEDENPPLFKMALEYTIDDTGMSVRLPANGIRFNETLYQLSYISVLPYMGAGNSGYSGYNFFPDGSGTLFDFEDLDLKTTTTVSGKVYGADFAYHEISGTYQEAIRYPVFGVVEDAYYYNYTMMIDSDTEETADFQVAGVIADKINAATEEGNTSPLASEKMSDGRTIGSVVQSSSATVKKVDAKRGYMAIIEEGDALAEISTYHAGSLSDYNTMQMQFNPRPKDSYNIADSISVGTNTSWTVVSKRKYVGSYKIRYIMLSDYTEETAELGVKTYDASWFGMATAYRDYLTKEGVLTPLTEEELTDDIPLYIETFGTLETLEKVLSIPVWVMTPLTTFDNVKDMYEDMSEGGIKNVNFRLTGYANGGMYSTVPYKFDIEKSVGGKDGFQSLLDYAADISKDKNANMGIFPDFNFNYICNTGNFDGVSLKKHAAQTIDGRYANRREWSATRQKYVSYYELAISPAYFSRFYEKLTSNYLDKFNNVRGISVSTLGKSLNSDFDEDEPYNREDAKEFTIKAFEYLDSKYDEIMTDGGNSFVWKYSDHILNVALDSSRYISASNAVPFMGVVLHGSIKFAGEPLNMEGNLNYAILKAIENGASPYFILSYQNTQNLKDYGTLSQYYSVRYDIWKNDLVDVYNTINNALSDVQDKYIINHEFLNGERVPDADELENDILDLMNKYSESEINAVEIAREELMKAAGNARAAGRLAESYAIESVTTALENYSRVRQLYRTAVDQRLANYITAINNLNALIDQGYDKLGDAEDEESKKKYEEYVDAYNTVTREKARSLTAVANVAGTDLNRLKTIVENLEKYIEDAVTAINIVANAQNDTIVYEEGKDGDIWSITNFDELSSITRESIERARTAYTLFTAHTITDMDTSITLPTTNQSGKLEDGTQVYYVAYGTGVSSRIYFSVNEDGVYTYYSYDSEAKTYTVLEYDVIEYATINGATLLYHLKTGPEAEDCGYYTFASGRFTPVADLDESTLVLGGEKFEEVNGTDVFLYVDGDGNQIYYSGANVGEYKFYNYVPSIGEYYELATALFEETKKIAIENGITEEEIIARINRANNAGSNKPEPEEEEEYSKYATENIVAVTYGTSDGKAYKSALLNYNNYSVNVVYEDIQYTIPAYGFVIILR